MESMQDRISQEEKAKKTNWDRLDVGIEHQGRAIILPGDPAKMPISKAIEALQRKEKDENQPYNVHEVIEGYPLDAAVAFVKAMAKLYGWASPVSVPGFFGPRPPEMISVKTGLGRDDVVQCPLGGFKLPGIEPIVHTLIGNYGKKSALAFVIHAEIKKKDRHVLLELANETRRIVQEESIYRGKAIRLGVDEEGNLDIGYPPEFIDTSDISEGDLIFDEHIRQMVDTNLLVPIRHTDAVRKNRIPLKRGVLLEGPYGTGKSLLARLVAHECEVHGWTFVLLDKSQGLRQALEFAKMFEPAVVFAEDIDRVMVERDENANDLINTIDGVISKKSEIMIVLTTNFAEKLDKVILRPGRLDAVISLRAPTDEAVERLLRHYAGRLLDNGTNLKGAGKALSGQIPASIRECVERAKLGMVGRGDTKLSNEDLEVAAATMKNHMLLLNGQAPAPTDAEVLAQKLRSVVTGKTVSDDDNQTKTIRRIDRNVEEVLGHVN